MKKKKRKRASDVIAIIIMIVAIGAFLYAAYQLYQIFSEYNEGTKEYDILREYVRLSEGDSEDTESEEIDDNGTTKEIPSCPVSVDFASLKTINPDIVGWLYVEALPQINYPIVQGTDNSYYLKHTFDKVANSSASIFMDYRNNSDFSDSNTIIYGHNMKNQSMFGLLKYMKEPERVAESPYIWIVTENEEICYEVFSVRDVSETDALYNLLQEEPPAFLQQLEQFQQVSLVENSLTFNGNEKIITLSTCTSDDTVRCVVQAVRKEF